MNCLPMMCICDFCEAIACNYDQEQNTWINKYHNTNRKENRTYTSNKQQCTPGEAKASSDKWSLKINLFQYSSLVFLVFFSWSPSFNNLSPATKSLEQFLYNSLYTGQIQANTNWCLIKSKFFNVQTRSNCHFLDCQHWKICLLNDAALVRLSKRPVIKV